MAVVPTTMAIPKRCTVGCCPSAIASLSLISATGIVDIYNGIAEICIGIGNIYMGIANDMLVA